ncbi:MAG: hypothetical protein DSY42_02640 [Aquifex sp.]|nr:MAG: hypothetical protein DSY42_02640 [Aquifex sp.]
MNRSIKVFILLSIFLSFLNCGGKNLKNNENVSECIEQNKPKWLKNPEEFARRNGFQYFSIGVGKNSSEAIRNASRKLEKYIKTNFPITEKILKEMMSTVSLGASWLSNCGKFYVFLGIPEEEKLKFENVSAADIKLDVYYEGILIPGKEVTVEVIPVSFNDRIVSCKLIIGSDEFDCLHKRNFKYIFTRPGFHLISVKAKFQSNGEIEKDKEIIVSQNKPPSILKFEADKYFSEKPPFTVNFSYTVADREGNIKECLFVSGEENKRIFLNCSSKGGTYTFTYTYEQSGKYKPAIIVRDDFGEEVKASLEEEIFINSVPEIRSFKILHKSVYGDAVFELKAFDKDKTVKECILRFGNNKRKVPCKGIYKVRYSTVGKKSAEFVVIDKHGPTVSKKIQFYVKNVCKPIKNLVINSLNCSFKKNIKVDGTKFGNPFVCKFKFYANKSINLEISDIKLLSGKAYYAEGVCINNLCDDNDWFVVSQEAKNVKQGTIKMVFPKLKNLSGDFTLKANLKINGRPNKLHCEVLNL